MSQHAHRRGAAHVVLVQRLLLGDVDVPLRQPVAEVLGLRGRRAGGRRLEAAVEEGGSAEREAEHGDQRLLRRRPHRGAVHAVLGGQGDRLVRDTRRPEPLAQLGGAHRAGVRRAVHITGTGGSKREGSEQESHVELGAR